MLEQFLAPSCTPMNLDIFLVRSAILRAMQDTTRYFSRTLLDVGCGHMPYKSLVLAPPSCRTRYVGLDLERSTYGEKPDILWDGNWIPLPENVVDCALATEVFEHCSSPEIIMGETLRVLKPGSLLFFSVPFLWLLHDVPHDEYRYTPFTLERHLRNSGFTQIKLKALGGWDASLAQTIGLWVICRPMSSRKRTILSRLALPIIRYLARRDRLPGEIGEGLMITALSGTAIKPLMKC
jgi:SAM-dependent methyltransferase